MGSSSSTKTSVPKGLALPDLLRRHAADRPQASSLSFEMETLTFQALDQRTSRLANGLRRQEVKRGDRIAVIARNSLLHFEMFFGCAKAGAILLPINWRLSPREIAAIIDDATPRLIFVGEEFHPALSAVASGSEVMQVDRGYAHWRDSHPVHDSCEPIELNDAALILYTSGTTGLPKGAMISHGNLSYVERMAREIWGFTTETVNLVAMPLFHIGGIGYGMMALSQGGHTVVIQQPTPAAVLEAIRAHRVTHAFFVPAVIQMLVDAPEVDEVRIDSLARILYGASPISEALLRRAIEVFGCAFNHAYGMTETAGTVVTLGPRDHDPGGPLAHRLRSCGIPVPWAEVVLVDPSTGSEVPPGKIGEIRIRSPTNMLGYWHNPEETSRTITPDGWLCTGDAADRDTDGYIYIRDRYKDMIVSGGENIFPTEIENVLSQHGDVAEVAVIGVAHPRWGETPKAFVVKRPGADLSPEELIAFTRARLAHYKCPTAVAFVKVLPRTPSGKVLKREMRDEKWLRSFQ